MKPQKHAEVIKAWAEGAEIEYKQDDQWFSISYPGWFTNTEYRIKPNRPEWQQKLIDAVKAGKTVEYKAAEYLDLVVWGTCRSICGDPDNYEFYRSEESDFRIKPKKVTRWQWIIKTDGRPAYETDAFYTADEVKESLIGLNGYKIIGKAEWTRMEFDE